MPNVHLTFRWPENDNELCSQGHVCRHIRHCSQYQLCTSPAFLISKQLRNRLNRDFLLVESSNLRPLIGREDSQKKCKSLPLIQIGTFGIVHNAKYPMGSQIYACRHIWHCAQCQISYGLWNLCVSTHLALCTMPNLLWALKSMWVDTFGIVHNAIFPIAPQFYVCRHIWHCAQCQLCTSPGFLISKQKRNRLNWDFLLVES